VETTTFPLWTPEGVATTIRVLLQILIVALAPLNVTLPDVVPKFVPSIATWLPTGPEVGNRLVIDGGGTVNRTPLLDIPLAVTTTLPVVARVGTTAKIDAAPQLVTVALIPLNVTVPAVVPKFVPVIVTDVFGGPEDGDMPVIEGGAVTVKSTPLLVVPLAVTTTLPVVAPLGTVAKIDVAPQLAIVAFNPLNVTLPPPYRSSSR
jgi:hypothetical protein